MRLAASVVFFALITAMGIVEILAPEKSRPWKGAKIVLVIALGIVGAYGFVLQLPTPAKPVVSHLEFFGMGSYFYCGFQARNAGDKECTVDGIEFDFPDAGIQFGESATFLRGHATVESGAVRPVVAGSVFPEYLSAGNQQFIVFGRKTISDDWPEPITVNVSFTSGDRKMSVRKTASTLKGCDLGAIRF